MLQGGVTVINSAQDNIPCWAAWSQSKHLWAHKYYCILRFEKVIKRVLYTVMGVCLWQKGFTMEPTAIICLQVKPLPLKDSQIKKVGGWVAKTVSSQWISQGVVSLYPRKGKTFPGQTSKVLVWLRKQTADCTRGRKELKRESRGTERTRSSNMSAGAICQHSSAHTRSVSKALQLQR